ncbi:MAG: hypothetical protein M1821_008431 [Bathelium mastoideum]|nr:MAG: hypothetical protein M1821_008431 [Bathelium mastoideum]
MASRSLPFYADPAVVPEALPTVEQIECAHEVLSDTAGRKVVGIGDHFVIKYGLQVDLVEGKTMLYLQESTTIPVPRIFALFQGTNTKNYIVMERIIGTTLEEEWSHLDQSMKESIASMLRSSLEQMRKLESPGGYCSLSRGGLLDGLFWTADPTQPFSGPFDTEDDLNSAIIANYSQQGYPKHKAEYYSRVFKVVFQNHPPKFSHGDFQRKNVIVKNAPKNGTRGELVIIDWEFAGWYPSYWEYARAIFACGRWKDDWSVWLDQILEPMLAEYAWMNMLLRELWS